MKLETIRRIDRNVIGAIGLAEIAALMVLAIFSVKALGQSIELDHSRPKKHVVYNYDPNQQLAISDSQLLHDNQRDLAVLTDEVANMRDEVRSLKPVETEGRISRLEATLDSMKQLLIGIAVAVGLMLVQSVHTIFKPKTLHGEEEPIV